MKICLFEILYLMVVMQIKINLIENKIIIENNKYIDMKIKIKLSF